MIEDYGRVFAKGLSIPKKTNCGGNVQKEIYEELRKNAQKMSVNTGFLYL